MAEIADEGGGGGGGKKRAKKGSTRVDMTPMVDLAFLLLTFFVLTSTFAKPKVMSLVYPAKDVDIPPGDLPPVNNAITFLVTADRVFYYKGEFYPEGNTKGKPATTLIETDFGPNGIRKLLAEENKFVIREKMRLDGELQRNQINDSVYKVKIIEAKKDKKALKVLIKTDEKAFCRNFIDVIDELYINSIGVIAPVDIMASELKLIEQNTK